MSKIVVYDPAHPQVTDAVIEYNPSANTPDYDSEPNKLVNPDLSLLEGIVPVSFWKRVGSTVVEMSQAEKDLIAPDVAEEMLLNAGNTEDPPTEDATICVQRFNTTNACLRWDETNDYWAAGLEGSEVEISLAGHTHAGMGDVTAGANITDHRIVRGDGGAKGIQDSAWTIADNGVMSASFALAAESFMIDIQNTTASGEFMIMKNHNGNPAIEFRSNLSGDGNIDVHMEVSGHKYFIVQDGVVKVGEGANDVNLNFDLLIDNSGNTAVAGGTLGFQNNLDQTVGIDIPQSGVTSWTLTLPVDDGASGQYLQTDGSGNTSWQTVTAGDVTAAANIGDNELVRGDGGAKGIQGSGWHLADDGYLTSTVSRSGYIFEVHNTLDTGGGHGFRVIAGEQLGDIAFHVADEDDTFQIMELEADQGYATFGKTYAQTLSDNGVVYGIDIQHPSVATDFNTQVGQYRMAGTPIPLQTYSLGADQVEYPRTGSDWNITVGAPASKDTNNSALTVRRFDDGTEEAIGWTVTVPPTARTMTVRTWTRAETGANSTMVWTLHRRTFDDNAAVGGWNESALTIVDTTADERWQKDESTNTLTNWNMTAGAVHQMMLSRDVGHVSDVLVGDAVLMMVEVEFS